MRLLAYLGMGVFLISGHALCQEKAVPIDLKVVKYDGLKQAVQQNRGKVVLVDFWGEF